MRLRGHPTMVIERLVRHLLVENYLDTSGKISESFTLVTGCLASLSYWEHNCRIVKHYVTNLNSPMIFGTRVVELFNSITKLLQSTNTTTATTINSTLSGSATSSSSISAVDNKDADTNANINTIISIKSLNLKRRAWYLIRHLTIFLSRLSDCTQDFDNFIPPIHKASEIEELLNLSLIEDDNKRCSSQHNLSSSEAFRDVIACGLPDSLMMLAQSLLSSIKLLNQNDNKEVQEGCNIL